MSSTGQVVPAFHTRTHSSIDRVCPSFFVMASSSLKVKAADTASIEYLEVVSLFTCHTDIAHTPGLEVQ